MAIAIAGGFAITSVVVGRLLERRRSGGGGLFAGLLRSSAEDRLSSSFGRRRSIDWQSWGHDFAAISLCIGPLLWLASLPYFLLREVAKGRRLLVSHATERSALEVLRRGTEGRVPAGGGPATDDRLEALQAGPSAVELLRGMGLVKRAEGRAGPVLLRTSRGDELLRRLGLLPAPDARHPASGA